MTKVLVGHRIIKGVDFGARFELYSDIQRNETDFSYGLNISMNMKVFEKTVK